MSKLVKIVLWSVGAWISLLVLAHALPVPVIVWPSYLLSWLASFVLLTLAAIALGRDKDRTAAGFAVVLVAMTAWFTLDKGVEWGARFHFQLHRGRYEAKLAQILAAADKTEREKRCGDDCWLMSDGPDVIAFRYAHGSGCEFVYDPTRAAFKSEEGKTVSLDYPRRKVRNLGGHWYWIHYID